MERYLGRRRWDHSRGLLRHMFKSFKYGKTEVYKHMSAEAQSLLLEAYEVYTCRSYEQTRPPTNQPLSNLGSTGPSLQPSLTQITSTLAQPESPWLVKDFAKGRD
ncbi:hypothetical protein RJT34_16661 [Clitoria ternatea]|uniref:Uncharacterized protein n=1 Tax=Clitoria ternatea TaxID=43366 RepID=A0AAN9J7I5_CLITE